jgi:Family of unknown function (DUF6152)
MTRTRPSSLLVAAALAAAAFASPRPAAAHHGWSGYTEKAETFTGVVREVRYGNPHTTIRLEAKDRTWLVVLAPPSRMESRGLPKDGLVEGEPATVEAYRHLTEEGELRAEWIELRGKRVQLR